VFYRKFRDPGLKITNIKPKTMDDFTLVELTTNRKLQLMSVKEKPISFKSRSKGAVDITIRNPKEFTRFLESGKFLRTHMSSLLSQVFDPAFIFNAIYHNVAKLINRRILTSNPQPLTMRVPRCQFPILEKLSQLFFETKYNRYALLPKIPMANMKNYIIGFADRPLNFSTS